MEEVLLLEVATEIAVVELLLGNEDGMVRLRTARERNIGRSSEGGSVYVARVAAVWRVGNGARPTCKSEFTGFLQKSMFMSNQGSRFRDP